MSAGNGLAFSHQIKMEFKPQTYLIFDSPVPSPKGIEKEGNDVYPYETISDKPIISRIILEDSDEDDILFIENRTAILNEGLQIISSRLDCSKYNSPSSCDKTNLKSLDSKILISDELVSENSADKTQLNNLADDCTDTNDNTCIVTEINNSNFRILETEKQSNNILDNATMTLKRTEKKYTKIMQRQNNLFSCTTEQSNISQNLGTFKSVNESDSCVSIKSPVMPLNITYFPKIYELAEIIIALMKEYQKFKENIADARKFNNEITSRELENSSYSQLAERRSFFYELAYPIVTSCGPENIKDVHFRNGLRETTRFVVSQKNILKVFSIQLFNDVATEMLEWALQRLNSNNEIAVHQATTINKQMPVLASYLTDKYRQPHRGVLGNHVQLNIKNKVYKASKKKSPGTETPGKDTSTYDNFGRISQPINEIATATLPSTSNSFAAITATSCKQLHRQVNPGKTKYVYSNHWKGYIKQPSNKITDHEKSTNSLSVRSISQENPPCSSISSNIDLYKPSCNNTFDVTLDPEILQQPCSVTVQVDDQDIGPPITFVASLSTTTRWNQEGQCAVCARPTALKCQGCESIFYCSTACHGVGWEAEHQFVCASLK